MTSDPVNVGLLGADRAILETNSVATLVQKYLGRCFIIGFSLRFDGKRLGLHNMGVVEPVLQTRLLN